MEKFNLDDPNPIRSLEVANKINYLLDEQEKMTDRLNALFNLYAIQQQEQEKMKAAIRYLAREYLDTPDGQVTDEINDILEAKN